MISESHLSPAGSADGPLELEGPTMSAPVPATRSGNCECCATAYRAGTPIVWDSVVGGWVLAPHRSAGSRR